jgi:serine/threonine protein kinase
VRVFDAGTTEDRHKYIVMEFLAGVELRELIVEAMPVARAVDLMKQIFAALDHAHRRGFVHRDLKPENVFVVQGDQGEDVVKIVDFGLVKILDPQGDKERLTGVGMVFGTPAYMSPEQTAAGKVDLRADLYAAGVVFHELLNGEQPFRAEQPGFVLRMHLIKEPPPLPDTVPEAVQAVVFRLMAKAASDRFGSAAEAGTALEQAYTPRPRRSHPMVFLQPPKAPAAPGTPGDTLIGAEPLADLDPDAPPTDGPRTQAPARPRPATETRRIGSAEDDDPE